MKDEQIVDLFRQRSEEAIVRTQEKYGRYCSQIARNILGNEQDGEECVNAALYAAWRSIPPQQPGNLKAYMGKLTRETAISRWRENHAAKRLPAEFAVSLEEIEEIAADEDFSEKLEKEQAAAAVSAFLRTLPEKERSMMIRRYWYCDSVKSISEGFDCSEGSVKVRLRRTREKLKRYLLKEGWIV